MNYIAHTSLTQTENLGSQMWHFATMTVIARRTGHRILFFDELTRTGKGLQLTRCFDDLPLEVVPLASLSPEQGRHLVFPVNNTVVVDSAVFRLDPRQNYNFHGLFISYKYWYPERESVAAMYRFGAETLGQAAAIVEPARHRGRPVVSVHVRRTDYLNGVFVNPSAAYYEAAFRHFDASPVTYLVFSDDLDWCRATFGGRADVIVTAGDAPIVDMAAMSLCDHHVIANSSFSFWGAFLNRRPGRRVICPARTLKADAAIPHVNHAWHPDEFIGLDAGNE
jgi:hypothetical protein